MNVNLLEQCFCKKIQFAVKRMRKNITLGLWKLQEMMRCHTELLRGEQQRSGEKEK